MLECRILNKHTWVTSHSLVSLPLLDNLCKPFPSTDTYSIYYLNKDVDGYLNKLQTNDTELFTISDNKRY